MWRFCFFSQYGLYKNVVKIHVTAQTCLTTLLPQASNLKYLQKIPIFKLSDLKFMQDLGLSQATVFFFALYFDI